MKKLLIAYFFGSLLCWTITSGTVLAQHSENSYLQEDYNTRPFPDADWNKATKGMDYTLKPGKPLSTAEQPDKKNNQKKKTPERPNTLEIAETIIKILAITILLLLLAFVFFQRSRKLRRVSLPDSNKNFIEDEEILLPPNAIDTRIREAESKGDFEAAIRFRYLGILQALEQNAWIEWKREKTNKEYTNEVKSSPFIEAFIFTTRIFDRVRYGHYIPDENQYRTQVAPAFKELLEQITNTQDKNSLQNPQNTGNHA